MKTSHTLLSSLLCLFFTTSSFAAKKHWSYEGAEAPVNWANISQEYKLCGSGVNQSPINIQDAVDAELGDIEMAYLTRGAKSIINNEHTLQVNYEQGSELIAEGVHYGLKQFHFHSPSENQINGHAFPLEVHLVHSDKNAQLAVVSLFFELGAANSEIEKLIHEFPRQHLDTESLADPVDIMKLIPHDTDYYRFNGSLTTPPCTEGVKWFVMQKPMTISEVQFKQLKAELGHDDNRPIQPLNARIVLKN